MGYPESCCVLSDRQNELIPSFADAKSCGEVS